MKTMKIMFEDVSHDMIITYFDGEPCGSCLNKNCKACILVPYVGLMGGKEETVRIKGILVT